jgi:PAS domain S-box-containing protein
MDAGDYQTIRELLDDYLQKYSSRDDRLTADFSEDFSGFTGGGDFLVKDREEWVEITRQDFAQIKDPIHIELKDLAIQSLSDTIAVASSCFIIHLPIEDHVLSRKTARLVLIFRKESAGWKISHSSISIPFGVVRKGEVYPLKELLDRNEFLEELVAQRTIQLSEANHNLGQTIEELAREIAEHKQVEEALSKNRQQYDNLVSKIPVGIYTLHSRPGGVFTLDYVSPRMAEMLNATAESLLAGPQVVLQSIHPDDLDAFVKMSQDRLQHLRPLVWKGRVLAGGTVKWLHLVSSPEVLDSGDVLWHGLVADITQDQQAEENKKNLEATNRQLQKTESLGRMARAVAHHFNNQLTVVIGNLHLAMLDLSKGESPHTKIGEAMKASDKAAEMSGLMLTYLGQSFDKHEPLDLAETCRQSLPMLKTLVSEDVVLEANLPSPGPVIMANANQILQVLTNLTTNAGESVGAGRGTIHLCVKTVFSINIPVLHRFPLEWEPNNNAYACVELRDTGCGIEDKDIEKLFDPFFSTKFTGRGMGLPVVLGIVRAHGGGVTVESEPSRSSTFRVFIPVSGQMVLDAHSKAADDADPLPSCSVP